MHNSNLWWEQAQIICRTETTNVQCRWCNLKWAEHRKVRRAKTADVCYLFVVQIVFFETTDSFCLFHLGMWWPGGHHAWIARPMSSSTGRSRFRFWDSIRGSPYRNPTVQLPVQLSVQWTVGMSRTDNRIKYELFFSIFQMRSIIIPALDSSHRTRIYGSRITFSKFEPFPAEWHTHRTVQCTVLYWWRRETVRRQSSFVGIPSTEGWGIWTPPDDLALQ